jgi:Holliday junction resolvase YEN1
VYVLGSDGVTNARSIYKEIGPGRRIALSKLALEKFEDTGRPLRIAIDTSIWLFQIQASKGTLR